MGYFRFNYSTVVLNGLFLYFYYYIVLCITVSVKIGIMFLEAIKDFGINVDHWETFCQIVVMDLQCLRTVLHYARLALTREPQLLSHSSIKETST